MKRSDFLEGGGAKKSKKMLRNQVPEHFLKRIGNVFYCEEITATTRRLALRCSAVSLSNKGVSSP